MSPRFMRSFSHTLAAIPAVFLIHIGGAAAGDSAGDVQQQIRELLSGRTQTQAAAPVERGADRTVTSPVDAQDSARRLLLGLTDSQGLVTSAIGGPAGQRNVHVYGDAQAMARSLILGQSQAAKGAGMTRGQPSSS